MKIISCFSRLGEIAALAEAGAAELYCGLDQGSFVDAGLDGGRKALETAIVRAHALGLGITLAVNRMQFDFAGAERRRFVEDLLALDRLGIDNFIVANPAILLMVNEHCARQGLAGLRAGLHLSSVQPCFNHLAVRFFQRFGFRRLILSNQLSCAEAIPILRACRKAGVETEIFDYIFFGCPYINGRCDFHALGTKSAAPCRPAGSALALKARPLDPRRSGEVAAIRERFAARMQRGGPSRISNPASFFDFVVQGVQYVKFGTRMDPLPEKVRKVRLIAAKVRLVQTLIERYGVAPARRAFLAQARKLDRMGWPREGAAPLPSPAAAR